MQSQRYNSMKKIPPLRKIITFADVATLANVGCGVGSIFSSASMQFSLAAYLLLGSLFFDFIDGKIARVLNQKGVLGKDLDSLADAISFGAAPALFGYMMGLDNVLSITILVFFVAMGVLRLARFNVLELDYYVGMPITLNGLLIPVFYFLGGFTLGPHALLLFASSAILMVAPFRVKKFI